jgi:hypothetical protein
MTLPKKNEGQNGSSGNLQAVNGREELSRGTATNIRLTLEERLEQLESLPRRNPFLHWAAFVASLLSLILLAAWVLSSRATVPTVWIWVDVGLGAGFAIEFFTRSGFRWDWAGYIRSRFFEFAAIVPALALVNQGFPFEGFWVWLILIVRAVRVIDRFLGDGFVQRNVLALVEGFEEEITDRVLERIVANIQTDLDRAEFSHNIAEAIKRNKSAILQRIHDATPHEGLLPGAARLTGLDKALERAEERTYDAVVELIDSKEVDAAVRDVIRSSFSRIRTTLQDRKWRRHMGIRSKIK